MDLPPAPDILLKGIRCNCSTGCGTMRCGCKKNGLPCSQASGTCQETSCDNCLLSSTNVSNENIEDSDTEDYTRHTILFAVFFFATPNSANAHNIANAPSIH